MPVTGPATNGKTVPTQLRIAATAVIAAILVAACADADTRTAAEVGEIVYRQRCQACHGPQGRGAEGGPAVAGASEEAIRSAVIEGSDAHPGFGAMAPLPLSPGHLDSVVAYLTEPDQG
jgi:mono/diheme cytochrome c family protein